MTTPTTAEQISGIREEFTREYSDYFGETHEELDADRLVQALLDARATIARLEASNRDLEAAVHTYRKSADAAKETIARLEGERDAALAPYSIAEKEGQGLLSVGRELIALRTRADAAERRVDDMTPLARLGEWALERIRGVYAGDVDAFDVQEKATEFGVIAPQAAPKPCGDCCVCAEMDADVCYRDTDTTTRARAALAAASGAADGAATTEG